MTSDGVGGTAAGDEAGSDVRRAPIKRDDERLAQRYIESANPHTPAGATPNTLRRERQVASALRNCSNFAIASLSAGATGSGDAVGARQPPARRAAQRPR